MTLIIDSSFLVALYDGGEVRHQRAFDFAVENSEVMFVPYLVLPEVSFLLRRNLGYANSLNFFSFFEDSNVRLVPLCPLCLRAFVIQIKPSAPSLNSVYSVAKDSTPLWPAPKS